MLRWCLFFSFSYSFLLTFSAYFRQIHANTYKGVILFCPGGRKETMEIQIQYVLVLLQKFDSLISQYDIWDVAWSEEDSKYLKELSLLHPKIRLLHTPWKGAQRAGKIGSQQFAFIYSTFYKYEIFKDYIFIKLDDDIVFIDIFTFPRFLLKRIFLPDSFLLSAYVVNNQVSLSQDFSLIHGNFINNTFSILFQHRQYTNMIIPHSNKLYLSINFICFSGADLLEINREFSNGIGEFDEYRLSILTPNRIEVRRNHSIDPSFIVVHFSYHHTDYVYLEKEFYLNKYRTLAKEYFQNFDEDFKKYEDNEAIHQVQQYFSLE